MLRAINRAVSRVVGGSQQTVPEALECAIISGIRNDALEECTFDTCVSLIPQIEEGCRLSFQMSPYLRTTGGAAVDGGGWNLLGHLRDSLKLDAGERIVILTIERLQVASEISAPLEFVILRPFDVDPETQAVRARIDEALASDNREMNIKAKIKQPTSPPPLPPKKTPLPPRASNSNANDNNTDVTESDTEMDPSVAALMNAPASDPIVVADGDEDFVRADAITVRGKRLDRNQAEMKNAIALQTIKAKHVDCTRRVIYNATADRNMIMWFAGQETYVMEKAYQIVSEPNLDPETRGKKPLTEFMLCPHNHALVHFIEMFSEDLNRKPDEMRKMVGDRDPESKWYRLSMDLVRRAREMITVVVYAQIYYTTLRDCTLSRIINSEREDYALLLALAAEWKLKIEKGSGRIADWAPGEYRPVVTITLRIHYFRVNKVRDSAAALHKDKTFLTVV